MQNWTDDQLACFMKEAYCNQGEESGCMAISTIETVAGACGAEGDDKIDHITEEDCQQNNNYAICNEDPVSDGEAFTVDLNSADTAFQLYAQFSSSQGEDTSNLQYWIGAMEEERFCNGDCWGGPNVGSCNGQTACPVNISGQQLNNFLTDRGKINNFNNEECVDMWWEWDVSGIEGGSSDSSNLLHLRLQKTAGNCP